MRRIFLLVIFITFFVLVSYLLFQKKAIAPTLTQEKIYNNQDNQLATPTPAQDDKIFEPISQALSRISKKPFGLKVSPQDSPVSPEKFSGYHTGVDFETNTAEQNIDVSIYAICSGKLLLKKYATGYGGLAVQACQINGEDFTVIYGHLRLSSIGAKVGGELEAGERLGVLGTGFSTETDGERKHLHLGLHRGSGINILGYVKNSADLGTWLDIATLLE